MTTPDPLDPSWAPSSCTLPTVERPLREHEFDDLFATAVTGTERTDRSTARLLLRPDTGVASRAAGLAMRESACCSFFTFTLSISAAALVLTISVPDRHVAVLDALLDRAGR